MAPAIWGMTGNRTILPDGHGSATFKAMLQNLGLLADVTIARQDSATSRALPPSTATPPRWP